MDASCTSNCSAAPVAPYYDRDGITIYHGDCRDILPTLGQFDLMLTDPPYELTASGGGIGAQRDYLADIEDFTDGGFDETILESANNWICFCAKTQLPSLLVRAAMMPRWMLVTWNKPNPTPLSNGNYLPDTEYIIHGCQAKRIFGEFRDKSRFILHPAQQHNLHPNEKPLEVVGKMLRIGSMEGERIIDPFMGSGTTLLSAKLHGRRAVGIERELKYCEIAARRLRQGILFGGMDAAN
jgi:site-specific DNA-methyltransferase (adenine-specific)